MDAEIGPSIYWDGSAVLSALVKDSHSDAALNWIQKEGLHFVSTLAYAEVFAVLDRMERERILTKVLVQSAVQAFIEGPWRFLTLGPAREQMDSLRGKYSLRGADFWHLSLAKTLKREIPDLIILSFDGKLKGVAEKEGFPSPK
ncbi:MAG TPA: type II toxin-antitoxin system VapC family toxin [Thermodesulfobacteriota bacterium]|nr:type II toxin-antitoxin system VapC family toxin [Thermodesulfobacteriota bacterium]